MFRINIKRCKIQGTNWLFSTNVSVPLVLDYLDSGVNRGVSKKENLQPVEIQSVGDLLGDPYRIQTCNLLIRSQILYSVELTGHTAIVYFRIAVQRYGKNQ